jgi:hypothetical protein
MEDDKPFDVVVDVLQKHRDKLWKMTQQNMNTMSFNIMDSIRLEQIEQLDEAIALRKQQKENHALQEPR